MIGRILLCVSLLPAAALTFGLLCWVFANDGGVQ
jgi:hypothetical protein